MPPSRCENKKNSISFHLYSIRKKFNSAVSMKHLTHDFFSQPFRLSFMQFDRGITNRNGGWKERVHLLRKPHGIQVALCVSRRLKSFPISVLRYHAPANSPTRNPAGNPLPGLYSQSPFECVNLLDLFFTIFLFLFFFFFFANDSRCRDANCVSSREQKKRRKKEKKVRTTRISRNSPRFLRRLIEDTTSDLFVSLLLLFSQSRARIVLRLLFMVLQSGVAPMSIALMEIGTPRWKGNLPYNCALQMLDVFTRDERAILKRRIHMLKIEGCGSRNKEEIKTLYETRIAKKNYFKIKDCNLQIVCFS